MASEEAKDPLKGVDWKAIGSELQKDPSASNKPVIKKRLPKKIRQIPDCYFLPRMPTPSIIAFYGACVAGGIGAGMLLEVWINNKIKGVRSRMRLAGLTRNTAQQESGLESIVAGAKGYSSLENKIRKIVDVRGVARALLLVYEKPEAEGRYICTAHTIKARDLVDKLRSTSLAAAEYVASSSLTL
ncbi:hypothetical protein J1N35_029708 [Gossypium stocksii]|uniref:Uncharacterized protein n=1 Tax=Gossypium stocksii TaxID=47602 RepID=A0A9D3UYF7_9ROSI|nr:hypothetical protein J1N35_029708 [Gossypium stocksii]